MDIKAKLIIMYALQMDKAAMRHFQKLCFVKSVYQSVRELRAKGADVQVHVLAHRSFKHG